MIPVQFIPDAQIGAQIDRRMRQQLAASLEHIIEAGDPAALPPGLDEAAAALTAKGPIDPMAFAAYFRGTEALLNGDTERAGEHFRYLREVAYPITGLRTADLGAPSPLGTRLDYYQTCFDTDPDTKFELKAAAADRTERGEDNVRAGLELLRQAAPETAGEFESIVHELVLIEDKDPTAEYSFDGGSSYQSWGALALNVGREKPPVLMAETLAHEGAHSFLFGHTIEEPLVRNPDDQLYKSPLRYDPRPMDGIYHATFVTARMHYAMDRLIRSEMLSPDDRDIALTRRAADAAAFRDGFAVVTEHGDLSPAGALLMKAASDYMANADG